MNGKETVKTMYEVTGGQMIEKAPLNVARSNFGCCVYPNFSQIFIAGGSVNENESTKSCERYIVKENVWKKLPELREAKINAGLCFFNQGSTLYCFGGATKTLGIINQCSSIERLSKGQNTWLTM